MKSAAYPKRTLPEESATFPIRTSRVLLRLPLIYRWKGRWFDGTARDLGIGGTFLECEGAAPEYGSTIEIVLDLDRAMRPLHVSAIVRWHEPAGFGVQFQQLGAYETHVLTRILGAS